MATFDLDNILKIFSGAVPSAAALARLRNDVMFMTLARATSADTNIQNIEVERVITVLKTHTGNDYSAADIRVAAQSAIFESVSLQRYLTASAKKITWQDRLAIVHALVDIIQSDGRTSDTEITYINDVVAALKLTPAQLLGLNAES
ncbi:MAG: putative tellurite resistance protein B-like protein [Candidatus Azotimanducaceae bacterium]